MIILSILNVIIIVKPPTAIIFSFLANTVKLGILLKTTALHTPATTIYGMHRLFESACLKI
jgi:hypothetical protein